MTAPIKNVRCTPERAPVGFDTAADQRELADWFGLPSCRVIGKVMVITGQFRSHAVCTCGWDGGARLWRARAFYDALSHAAGYRCQLAFPLVAVTKRYA